MDVRDIEVFNFVMLVVFSSGIHNSSVQLKAMTKQKKYVGSMWASAFSELKQSNIKE